MNKKTREPYLPRCVSKKELAIYFGVSHKWLWANLITEDLINDWGFEIEEVKPRRIFPPDLTLKIYRHFDILDLNLSLYEELSTQ